MLSSRDAISTVVEQTFTVQISSSRLPKLRILKNKLLDVQLVFFLPQILYLSIQMDGVLI